MKRRKYLAAALLLSGVMAFSGCGNEKKENAKEAKDTNEEAVLDEINEEGGSSHENALDFEVGDYVKLGDYKKLKVQYPIPEVTQEDVDFAIQELQEEHTEYKEITDRPAQNGDTVNIDYTGVLDGEAFDGGSDTDYEFVLGEGEFLEEFEAGLIGKNANEAITFPVTFPEDYDEELGGKTVEFTATINKISEAKIPEFTDEFVAKVSDYTTKEEYEKYIKEDLQASAEAESASAAGEEALGLAVENATVEGHPQELYDFYYEETMVGYQSFAEMFGMEYEEFMEQMGDGALEEAALAQVNEFLVAQAIAEQEGLAVTEESYQEGAKALMEENEYESMEDFEADFGKISIITQLVRGKVVDFLYENAELEKVTQEEYYGRDEEEDEGEDGTEEDGAEEDGAEEGADIKDGAENETGGEISDRRLTDEQAAEALGTDETDSHLLDIEQHNNEEEIHGEETHGELTHEEENHGTAQ